MSVNSELKSWLERPKLTAITSLELAIKVWNSVEFMYTSKYDVIVEHFTGVLKRPSDASVDQQEFLKIVKEFINLTYPIGALSQTAKKSLVNAVVGMHCTDNAHIQEHISIIRALQMHPRMANFYNSNQKLFGEIVSKLFDQHLVRLEKETVNSAAHIDEIKQHLKDIRTYCQYNLSTESFDSVFATAFMPSLTKVVIQCQSMDLSVDQDYFSIVELIFFNTDKAQKLREFFKNYPAGDVNLFQMFPSDHILLVFLDGLLATYRNDKEMVDLLLSCVFEKMPSEEFAKTEILIFRHILFLLRKYDVNVSHYQTTIIGRISSLIMSIVAKKSHSLPVEVLDLICQAVQWNPLIIHDEVLVVIVHFMTVDKVAKTTAKFAELQRRVMSGRLNRFEKRTGKLLELVKGEMDKLIVGQQQQQQLKRKAEVAPTPSKKKKKLNDGAVSEDTVEKENHFLGLIEASYSSDKASNEVVPTWDPNWSSLSNMWPKSVSQLWGQSVSNLVSKTSMIIWKALLINLNESLEIAAQRSFDQQSILYNKFVCCFLVEYLSATRLLEHTDQQFDVIQGMCDQTKEALKRFGKSILETEHNTELVSAFLSVTLKYGSFETSLLYYHPDSIADENSTTNLRKIDFKERAHSVHDFLTAAEWSLIEQRVINFGKESCRSMFHDLNFRKVRSIALCDPEFVCKETKTWNKAIIGDWQLLRKFSEQCVYFEEFVRDLTRKQRTTLAKTIFESEAEDNFKEMSKFVALIGEQYELMELSAIVLLNVISEKHLPKTALLKSVDFATLMQQQDGDISLPDIEELLLAKQQGGDTAKAKKVEDHEGLLNKIQLINALPLGYLKEREKELFYTLQVLLCYDLTGHLDLQDLVLNNIRMIRELGFRFDGLKYLTLSSQLQMLPTRAGRAMVLDTVGNFFGDSQLKQIKALLKKIAKDEEQHEDLVLLMGERFSLAKKNHKNEKTMAVYKMKMNKLVFQVYERNHKEGEDSSKLGAAGLLYALNMYLANKDNLTEANADLGKLCLRVARHKLMEEDEAEEEHKSKIIAYCFQHMTHLVLDAKDLESVLHAFWQRMREIKDIHVITTKSKVDLLALFNLYAATEKYIEILTEIAEMAERVEGIEELRVICKLLQILSKSGVNQAKGMVLSEFLKRTLEVVILKFTLQVDNVYDHPDVILDILKCFSIAAQNRQIVMSQSLFANILSFCLDINLKRFKVSEMNTETFDRIHQQLTQLCTNLIQARSLALKNAMPQFVSLMKDLIHTICAFRNERSDLKQKLTEDEVKMLSTLAHRLEPILNGFADRDHLGRKVAPYLLVYVINEMIFNPNSTTLYPGVKLAINNVCYKLIAICDVKYSQFILRGCSEASRDVYKTLVKEYEQYYKFQGKV